jgi:hypothetical protein
MTAPSETFGGASRASLAFFAIQSRAARMLSSVPAFVLANRDGKPTASGADKRIAHETLDWHYDLFHFRRPLLKNIEKLLRASASSHDCMHDIPPEC